MEFLKKHYEKLILSVVLLGLAAVAATLPMKVNQEKTKEEERKNSLINPKITPFPPVNLATNQAVLEKVKSPIHFDIAGKHNLFNPVPWVQKPNGEVIKVKTGNEVGIGALEVTAINPLHQVISFDEVNPVTGANGATDYKYTVTMIKEGSGGKQSRAMAVGSSDRSIGTLKGIQGSPDSPTGLLLVLPDKTEITLAKDKPFSKIIGYSADLRCEFPPLNKKGAKVGDPVVLGEPFTIKTIDKDTVVFEAKSNKKTIPKQLANTK
jgi:hypothetical protein